MDARYNLRFAMRCHIQNNLYRTDFLCAYSVNNVCVDIYYQLGGSLSSLKENRNYPYTSHVYLFTMQTIES